MANSFQEHLDICEHCRENPFDLCPAGTVILKMELAAIPADPLSVIFGKLAVAHGEYVDAKILENGAHK